MTRDLSPASANSTGMSVDEILRYAIAAQNDWRERDARVSIVDALRRYPDEARLHQMLGALEHSCDEIERALPHFERAFALKPDNVRIGYALAQARLDGGLDARDAFRRTLALSPSDRQLRLGLLSALLAQGDGNTADAMLERWLREEPDWVDGQAALVRLRWQSGEGQAAWRTIAPAAVAAPENLELWRELILSLMHSKQYPVALAAIAQGRRLYGSNILFDSCEAGCLDELGDVAAAQAKFLAIGRNPNQGLALRFTRHLLRAHRPQDAAAVAEAWIDQPGAHHFWPYIATAWRITGDPRWQWLEGDQRLVGVYDLTANIAPLNQIAERLRDLHRTVHQPLEQSLRGGTQTHGRLLSRIDPELQDLRKAIVAAVETHMAQMPPVDSTHPTLSIFPPEVRISGSWSVRLTGQGYHAVHMHPQGWLSSAFYVTLPENMDATDSRAGWLTLGDQPEFTDCPPAFREVQPKPGTLVLFPSTMWHGTRPIDGGERMTVAFDVACPPGGRGINSPSPR